MILHRTRFWIEAAARDGSAWIDVGSGLKEGNAPIALRIRNDRASRRVETLP